MVGQCIWLNVVLDMVVKARLISQGPSSGLKRATLQGLFSSCFGCPKSWRFPLSLASYAAKGNDFRVFSKGAAKGRHQKPKGSYGGIMSQILYIPKRDSGLLPSFLSTWTLRGRTVHSAWYIC